MNLNLLRFYYDATEGENGGNPAPVDPLAAPTDPVDPNADPAIPTDPIDPEEPVDPDPEEPTEEDPAAYYAEVEQHTGRKVTVDYGEVDPLTPAGVALREQAVWNAAAEDFELDLKKRDPRGYAYLLHRDSGGSDEEFFAQKAFELPEEDAFKKSTDMQSSWVKRSLINAGVDEDIADAQVAKLIKDNKLQEKALVVYNKEKDGHANYLKELEDQNKAAQAEEQKAIDNVKNRISTSINTDLGFVIPETEKGAFNKFITDNIRMDGKDFYVTAKVGENLKDLINSLYFQFKKGDLKALVQKQANTKAVQKLRTAAQAAKDKQTKTLQEESTSKGFIPFGQL